MTKLTNPSKSVEDTQDELSSHAGKTMYGTKAIAENRIKSLRHSRLQPYKCNFCEGWHIGNSAKKKALNG